ncbi:MAG: hypothetical protein FJW95_06310 [Actinobacteria bacterium]|nr:hypothetical protein [Actinomycetota bacterium]
MSDAPGPDAAAPDPVPVPAGDALPEDLDVTAYVGPYQFPGTHRRRIAGTIYLGLAGLCAIGAVSSGNAGLVAATVLLVVIGGYHFLAAWHLQVDQTEALTIASRTVGFPVGHSSGQLGFRGLRSRPSWRILLYSADDPPSMRGLVELDGVDGTVLGEYTELNPEDWSAYGLEPAGGGGSES